MTKKNEKIKKPVGVVTITNVIALVVLDIDQSRDRVLTQYVCGNEYKGKPGWNKIYNDNNGNAYFRKGAQKYYLSDVQKYI